MIRSKPNNKNWYDNYDRAMGKTEPEVCRKCQRAGTVEDPIVIGQIHRSCHDKLVIQAGGLFKGRL